MSPLHFLNKGRIMSAIEGFEIYKAPKLQKHLLLNDQLSFESDSLHDTVLKYEGRYVYKWEFSNRR